MTTYNCVSSDTRSKPPAQKNRVAGHTNEPSVFSQFKDSISIQEFDLRKLLFYEIVVISKLKTVLRTGAKP